MKIRIEVWEEIKSITEYSRQWSMTHCYGHWTDGLEQINKNGRTVWYKVSYVNDELDTALDKISFYEAISKEQLKKDIGGIGR